MCHFILVQSSILSTSSSSLTNCISTPIFISFLTFLFLQGISLFSIHLDFAPFFRERFTLLGLPLKVFYIIYYSKAWFFLTPLSSNDITLCGSLSSFPLLVLVILFQVFFLFLLPFYRLPTQSLFLPVLFEFPSLSLH